MGSSGRNTISKQRKNKEMKDYSKITKRPVFEEEIRFVSRIMSKQKLHGACAVIGTVCTALAARAKGSLVHELLGGKEGKIVAGPFGSGTYRKRLGLRSKFKETEILWRYEG